MSFTHATISPQHARISLPPRLDSTQAQPFRNAIQQALSTRLKRLELDCTALEYLDSTGLGLLTLARGEAEVSGCTVLLTNVRWPGPVADVLMLVHFDHLFPMTFLETPGQPAPVPLYPH